MKLGDVVPRADRSVAADAIAFGGLWRNMVISLLDR
jgi:hypothetical protein